VEVYEKLLILRGHGMVKTPDMKPWDLGFNYRYSMCFGIISIKRRKIMMKISLYI